MSLIQSFAKQIFFGISFLHEKVKLTHTDLKVRNFYNILAWKFIVKKSSGRGNKRPDPMAKSKTLNNSQRIYYTKKGKKNMLHQALEVTLKNQK